MLTITRIINYGATDRPLKARAAVSGTGSKRKGSRETTASAVPQPITRTLTSAERQRARRATAAEKKLCGICVARAPEGGYKTCKVCRDYAKSRRALRARLN